MCTDHKGQMLNIGTAPWSSLHFHRGSATQPVAQKPSSWLASSTAMAFAEALSISDCWPRPAPHEEWLSCQLDIPKSSLTTWGHRTGWGISPLSPPSAWISCTGPLVSVLFFIVFDVKKYIAIKNIFIKHIAKMPRYFIREFYYHFHLDEGQCQILKNRK